MAKRKAKPHAYSGTTLCAENTGTPSKHWYQPPTNRKGAELADMREEVDSHLRHIEQGITPLVPIAELLARVSTQLEMDAVLEESYEQLSENFDEMESRVKDEDTIKAIISAPFREAKVDPPTALIKEIVKGLDNFFINGIAPTEES